MRTRRLLLIAPLVIGLGGCGGDGDGPGGDAGDEADAPVGDIDAPAGDIDAMAPCNTLTQMGTPVQTTQVAQNPPAPAGGTIPAGIYVRAAMTVYTGSGGPTGPVGAPVAETGRFNGDGTVDLLLTTTSDTVLSFQYATAGTGITFTATCPQGVMLGFDAYTVVDTNTMLLFNSSNDSVETIEFQ